MQAGQDGRRRDTHHVNNTLLRRKTEPTSLVSPRESSTQRRPPPSPSLPLSRPFLVSSSCFFFHDLSPATNPLSTIFTRTMMRSLAAIFPGFLPPLAVINATIPCHQKRKRLERGREREREENSEGEGGGGAALARRGHCWRGRNSVKCLRKLR